MLGTPKPMGDAIDVHESRIPFRERQEKGNLAEKRGISGRTGKLDRRHRQQHGATVAATPGKEQGENEQAGGTAGAVQGPAAPSGQHPRTSMGRRLGSEPGDQGRRRAELFAVGLFADRLDGAQQAFPVLFVLGHR